MPVLTKHYSGASNWGGLYVILRVWDKLNGMKSIIAKLEQHPLVIVPPPPARFTLQEWHLYNQHQKRTNLDQQLLSDKILAESERIRDELKEITQSNKREVEHKTEMKVKDTEFAKNELLSIVKEVNCIIERLLMQEARVNGFFNFITDIAIPIPRKCIILREGRLGIDLCHDDVERELHKEVEIMEKCVEMMKRILEQLTEQLRRLRSNLYFLQRDLADKESALKLDNHNLGLKEYHLNLSIYHGFRPLDPANITIEEWDEFTKQNIVKSSKEVNSSRTMCSYIDNLITQSCKDLVHQRDIVNEAFRQRLIALNDAKINLEMLHSECVRQSNEQKKNAINIQKLLAEKEQFMALAHTRLGNRAQRTGMELCRDLVETHLCNEVSELRQNCNRLQLMMAEVQASIRYLLKNQIQLETDINIKTNSMKIDDVDCMTLRQRLDYQQY